MKLPDKATYRVAEVAQHFDVTERTVYLWIAHGHLEKMYTPGGMLRITQESVEACRMRENRTEEWAASPPKPKKRRGRPPKSSKNTCK